MKNLFLSVAAAAALAVSAGSAAAQYNTAYPVPAPTAYTPAPTGYAPGPMMGAGGCDAGGCGFMHGHMGYMHGHMGGMVHGKLGGKLGGGKFLGGGLGIFTNHGHPFGKDDGGSLFGGLFAGINGGGQIQPVDPRGGNAGQLVFPQNPFVRGPRDYFMWEDR
jgi:hypothetical protein